MRRPIAGLARYLREHHESAIAARYSDDATAADETGDDGAVTEDGDAPLSFQQQSFWVLNRLYPSMTGSNEQFVIPLDGPRGPRRQTRSGMEHRARAPRNFAHGVSGNRMPVSGKSYCRMLVFRCRSSNVSSLFPMIRPTVKSRFFTAAQAGDHDELCPWPMDR